MNIHTCIHNNMLIQRFNADCQHTCIGIYQLGELNLLGRIFHCQSTSKLREREERGGGRGEIKNRPFPKLKGLPASFTTAK